MAVTFRCDAFMHSATLRELSMVMAFVVPIPHMRIKLAMGDPFQMTNAE